MKRIGLIGLTSLLLTVHAFAVSGKWTPSAAFPGINRAHYFQFQVNGKGYVGTGSYVSSSVLIFTKDVWQFDPVTDTWTQVADFGGNIRTGTMFCATNGYGYVGCGADQFATYNDWWQYDPAMNVWNQKTYFPAPSRVYGQGFACGDKAYCGLGRIFTPAGSTVLFNDIYCYEEATDSWLVKNNFPGAARSFAATFKLKDYNYIVGGQAGQPVDGVWKYDEPNDNWIAMNNFPGGARIGMTTLVVNDTAYAAFGRSQDQFAQMTYYNDLWQYDESSDTWVLKQSLPAAERFRVIGFGFDSLAYFSCGENAANSFNDGWTFNPREETVTGLNTVNSTNIKLINSVSSKEAVLTNLDGKQYRVTVYDLTGKVRYSAAVSETDRLHINVEQYAAGLYLINMKSANGEAGTFKFYKLN